MTAQMRSDPLRLLVLHSRYQSGPASGENRVVEDEIELLRSGGHQVEAWTPLPPERLTPVGSVRSAVGAVWSFEAATRVRMLIRKTRAQIVHVHNLFPMLSPAIMRVAAEENVPVVMTLHNYRLLCLPATFLRNGRACEDCLGHIPWRGIVHGCYRGSRAASTAIAASLTVHRMIDTYDGVKLFLAVSELVRAKHIEAGLPRDRFRVKPNFAWRAARREGAGEYFLYLGRLSKEKGLPILLEAWRQVKAPLVLVGDGDERTELERSAPEGVRFVGTVPASKAADYVRRARALLLPSTCYEGAPRSIPEAYAAGTPVIASDIGGIPECVWNEESGLLVPPGDAGALAKAAADLLDDSVSRKLGEGAYRKWVELYTPQEGLRGLERAYAEVLRR